MLASCDFNREKKMPDLEVLATYADIYIHSDCVMPEFAERR
jgi:hypothetical protein